MRRTQLFDSFGASCNLVPRAFCGSIKGHHGLDANVSLDLRPSTQQTRLGTLADRFLAVTERRLNERYAVDLDGILYCEGRAVGGCKIRNLAFSGALVEVRDLAFIPNSFVAIEIKSANGHADHILRWPARVVHSSAQVAGLVFETFDPLSRDFLEALHPFLAEHIVRDVPALG